MAAKKEMGLSSLTNKPEQEHFLYVDLVKKYETRVHLIKYMDTLTTTIHQKNKMMKITTSDSTTSIVYIII